jgi:hypothetical protein
LGSVSRSSPPPSPSAAGSPSNPPSDPTSSTRSPSTGACPREHPTPPSS